MAPVGEACTGDSWTPLPLPLAPGVSSRADEGGGRVAAERGGLSQLKESGEVITGERRGSSLATSSAWPEESLDRSVGRRNGSAPTCPRGKDTAEVRSRSSSCCKAPNSAALEVSEALLPRGTEAQRHRGKGSLCRRVPCSPSFPLTTSDRTVACNARCQELK